VLALLADGESWSSSALALAPGTSQRTVQRALDSLAAGGKVQPIGRGRARRWMTPPVPGFTTTLLLPAPLPIDWDRRMSGSTAEIVREYGPLPGADHVHGVTDDGRHVWFAAGGRLNALDPASGEVLRSNRVQPLRHRGHLGRRRALARHLGRRRERPETRRSPDGQVPWSGSRCRPARGCRGSSPMAAIGSSAQEERAGRSGPSAGTGEPPSPAIRPGMPPVTAPADAARPAPPGAARPSARRRRSSRTSG
jgi:hypothetical protein